MKSVIRVGLFLVSAAIAWAGESQGAAAAQEPRGKQTEQAVNNVDAVAGLSQAEIVVGERFEIKLPCNPTTGYGWELKSIDREIAAPTGAIVLQPTPAKPGLVGVGGTCVLGIQGMKPGQTTAILVYRRSWEKKRPAKTFKTVITVVPKKQL